MDTELSLVYLRGSHLTTVLLAILLTCPWALVPRERHSWLVRQLTQELIAW
jgi:hypothetical protein